MFPVITWLINAYQLKITCIVERDLAIESGDLCSSLDLDSVISLMQVGPWKHYHLGLSYIIGKIWRVRLNDINGCNTLEKCDSYRAKVSKHFLKRAI